MPSPSGQGCLREVLDGLVTSYGPSFLHTDPLRFPHRYASAPDREAAALLAALFAYGNVTAMGAFLERLFETLGPSPAEFLRCGGKMGAPGPYRFQTGEDVARVIRAVGSTLRHHPRLEALFAEREGTPEERLERFALALRERCGRLTPGIRHLLPLPSAGSACKRWWMFLRWVCRPADGLDLGLWSCVAPRDLRIPVDTHVARIAFALGLTGRRTPDSLFAAEVTASLARFCPEDPVRYDFALARLGIVKACRGYPVEKLCSVCSLRPHCALWRDRPSRLRGGGPGCTVYAAGEEPE